MKILYFPFVFCLTLFAAGLKAQQYGCTDPMATNYNPSATRNDGSCVYTKASVSPSSGFNLPVNLAETSGLIKWNDRLWTHNDDNDVNIYALDTAGGNLLKSFPLTGTVNTDWEEISQDNAYIYIGDFGNNLNGNRKDLKILRVDKRSILADQLKIDTISFSYSNQTDFTPAGANNTDFDCEAMIVSADSIYLFTKQWISKKTGLYSVAKNPGTYVAKLKATLDVNGLITGATSLEPKRLIVLCGYSGLLEPFIYLLYDYIGSDYFSGNKRKISVSLPFNQVEGIATSDGLKYYITNEHFTQLPFINNPQKLHILDLSPFLGNYFSKTVTIVPENKKQNKILVFPNPVTNLINVRINAGLAGTTFEITDQSGKTVMAGTVNNENGTIDIGILSSGVYLLSIGKNAKQTFKVIKN